MNINPEKQNVENCLGKTYYIDFYQRKYVWTKKTVRTLLKDIFDQFELSYEQHKDKDPGRKVTELYNWYYLNTYIINNEEGKSYIVDGQQRLTTLTLIAIYLYHSTNDENLKDYLKRRITGRDSYTGNVFFIDPDKRYEVMNNLMDKDTSKTYIDTTSQNINERYKDIDSFFQK